MRARPKLAILTLLLPLAATPTAASLRYVAVPDAGGLAAHIDAACATPSSPACAAALEQLALSSAFQLRGLGQRRDPAARPLAIEAAATGYPVLRAAAAEALGELSSAPEDTPVLAELLDDPVPAVRAAALRTLRRSVDETGRLLARRAEVFTRVEIEGDEPETPPAAKALGVPLPPDAVFLFFASDPAAGRYAFATALPPAQALAALRGRGPYTPEQFKDQIPGAKPSRGRSSKEDDGEFGDLPSPEEMERLMELAATMGELAKQHKGRPEEMAAAATSAMKAHGSFDASLAEAYKKDEFFGEARLVVVPLDGKGEAVVAVYTDKVLGMTGVAVHRAPLGGGE
jgi:hypothetical protein